MSTNRLKWWGLIAWKCVNVIECNKTFVITFGSDANTCCLTSQISLSDGNCKHLKTFNSGTWTRTKSHPSRASGGRSSSNPSPPANIGAWSIFNEFRQSVDISFEILRFSSCYRQHAKHFLQQTVLTSFYGFYFSLVFWNNSSITVNMHDCLLSNFHYTWLTSAFLIVNITKLSVTRAKIK